MIYLFKKWHDSIKKFIGIDKKDDDIFNNPFCIL